MTIYEELVERVSNGETFHIDFEKRTMKVGKDFLIKEGIYNADRTLFKDIYLNTRGVLSVIELFYKNYKYSLPSERSDSKKRTYFKALPIKEISDETLMISERREVAKSKLEGFILCMIIEGKFTWDDIGMDKWFYQSSNDNDLVILRKWIINN